MVLSKSDNRYAACAEAADWFSLGWVLLVMRSIPATTNHVSASMMVAVGHLVGYAAGAIDLEVVFGTMLGDTQFKRLTIIAGLALLLAVSVTSWAVSERVRLSDEYVRLEAILADWL